MTSRQQVLLLGSAAALSLAAAVPAHAHAVAGARVFVNTLLIDDPGVGDEANLPLYSVTSPDGKSTATDLNFEYDKTIFSTLGIGAGDDWNWLTVDQADNGKSHGGWSDPYIQMKYRWILLPEHEFMSSVEITESFGRAGTAGFESGYDTTTLSGFFGKGLGDIPVDVIRPFAITGELDYNIPNTSQSTGYGNVNTWSGGLTLQYSIPYLQSQIHDYGLPLVLANLTPLIELGWSSAASGSAFRPTDNPTTLNLGTGAVWTGEYYSLSTELLWPLNGASGHGLGVIGQFHLYFDDLFPDTLGKPLFGS
jgi:hypothetical protein